MYLKHILKEYSVIISQVWSRRVFLEVINNNNNKYFSREPTSKVGALQESAVVFWRWSHV